MFVIIVGGGKTGSHLAELLLAAGHKVRVIDRRPEVIEKLKTELPPDTAVRGDGADPKVLMPQVQPARYLVYVVLFAMLFAAGARVSYLLLAGVVAAPIAWHLVKSTPYRYARVVAFLDPERYRAGPGFQLWESLLGTANGGLLGQGLGQGKGKLFYLPAAHTDFIAAVIAEEAGLLGVLLLVGLFAIVVWRGLRAALNASDAFGCYAALGVTTLVGAQALVNLAVVFGLLPTKGLTLPFVSYGGSSLLTLLGGSGLLLSVSASRGGFLRRARQAVRIEPTTREVAS